MKRGKREKTGLVRRATSGAATFIRHLEQGAAYLTWIVIYNRNGHEAELRGPPEHGKHSPSCAPGAINKYPLIAVAMRVQRVDQQIKQTLFDEE